MTVGLASAASHKNRYLLQFLGRERKKTIRQAQHDTIRETHGKPRGAEEREIPDVGIRGTCEKPALEGSGLPRLRELTLTVQEKRGLKRLSQLNEMLTHWLHLTDHRMR